MIQTSYKLFLNALAISVLEHSSMSGNKNINFFKTFFINKIYNFLNKLFVIALKMFINSKRIFNCKTLD